MANCRRASKDTGLKAQVGKGNESNFGIGKLLKHSTEKLSHLADDTAVKDIKQNTLNTLIA